MTGPNQEFWELRYQSRQTGWDRGAMNPQLRHWLNAGTLKAPARIAVPGCGSGWEVAELAARGFDVTGLDYAPAAVSRARALLDSQKLDAELVQADVLTWKPDHGFDAIYEQTCLCALHPDTWVAYGAALHRWLVPGGRLFALFMQALKPEAGQGFVQGPPYHCDIHAMRAIFPAEKWHWEKPPHAHVPHPNGGYELGLCLTAR